MDPFLGEIRLMPYPFAPTGWLECNGQILQVIQNQALAALIGFRYGGNGSTTFALPDLRGRVALNQGNGVYVGTAAGSEGISLTPAQVPSHAHTVTVSKDAASVNGPTGQYPAKGDRMAWIAPIDNPTAMAADMLTSSGANAAHENRMPVLALRFCIATQGIWPPRQ